MDQVKIGAFLKVLRKERNMTQEQLAQQLGVSGRTVSRWETGSNMPDISLLVELAELYDVSIPEIINGERKSEKVNEEVKEVADKMADYAGAEKTRIIRNIRNHSLYGICAFIVLVVLELALPEGFSGWTDFLHAYCEALVYVSLIMVFLISTGLIHKFERKKVEVNLPKPVLLFAAAAVAFAVGVAIRFLLPLGL